jgi:O-antigen/teichoic acid export membrane protein
MRLPAVAAGPLLYGLSLALAKGVSLLLMPWVAAHLAPGEYGRLEIVTTTLEFVGLVLSFGLGDTLFRFAGVSSGPVEQRQRAALIAGAALVLAAGCAVLLQLAAPLILDLLPVPISATVFRLCLLAVAAGGLIELPLAWLRLSDRPQQFLAFMALRAVLQLVLVAGFVALFSDAEAVLAASSIVELVLAASLALLQFRTSGFAFSRESWSWVRAYSLPLLVSGLAAFALGSCDRWFLASQVPAADIGRYAIAGKLALSSALLMQSFGLWWYPRRLRVLAGADGLKRSADAVALGFAVLIAAAATVAIGGPAFIRLALPESYAAAAGFVPWLVLASVMNESASLLNVGVYARNTAWRVAAVNGAGAAVALALYALLIPRHGVDGAIAATLVAQAVRIAGFLWAGRAEAPIPYRVVAMAAAAVGGLAVVGLAQAIALPLVQVGLAVLVPALFAALALGLGLVQPLLRPAAP